MQKKRYTSYIPSGNSFIYVLTVSITISIAAYGIDGLDAGLIASKDVEKMPAAAIS